MLCLRRMIVCLTVIITAATQASAAIDIVFDYSFDTGNFFNTQQKRDTLDAAAKVFEDSLQDSLDAVLNYYGDGGWNTWEAGFYHPATAQWTSIDSDDMDYKIIKDRIVIYVGGRSMGSTTLGQGGPGGYSASGYTQDWFDLIKCRGEDGALDSLATDFGPWGGSIAFTTDTTWNYDHTELPYSYQNDLYSVALHEIAHVLGFGISDSWNDSVSGGRFWGDSVIMENGSAADLYYDNVHWEDDTLSEVPHEGPQVAIMTPNARRGYRQELTYLDYAALDDIGWDIQIPGPIYYCINGDINCDGIVGLLDLDILGRNWGSLNAGWAEGDLNGNGSVTLLDLDILGANWGNVAAPTPEPGSATLLCLAAAIFARKR